VWGIVPAAGIGSRIQPLAFSKELLPVGSRFDGVVERPCAVSEYLVERMIRAGANRICFVISPGKSDILEYYGGSYGPATNVYVVQPAPAGLCDALFRSAPLIARDETVLVGLPDTVWFPVDGFSALSDSHLSFLLFPVEHPEFFDAVIVEDDDRVREIQVKRTGAGSHWVWGAFRLPGHVFHDLHAFWLRRDCKDEYVGTLVNAWINAGGTALGIRAGSAYVDVGTLHGYRAAISLLDEAAQRQPLAAGARVALAWPSGRPGGHRHPSGTAMEQHDASFDG
jgi:dTDP-glucose pyrophosphorylase